MKNLLFFCITLIFIVLTAEQSTAQSGKTENCFTNNFYGYLPCTDEISEGEGFICITIWNGKARIEEGGTFKGTESGKVYTLSLIGNQIGKNYEPGRAAVINIETTASLKCEGATIALYKVKGHVTVNAKGEIVVNRYDWTDWVCK